MFVLLFVMFVSCQGFLLDGNTQTTIGSMSFDDKRYHTVMGLLTEERTSRSKLEVLVAQELLALREEVAKCQCGNGNGGHSQINHQGSLTDNTNALKVEIIQLKRDHGLLKTEVVELTKNNTVLKYKVVLLERNLDTIQNKQSDFRNETSRLETALQITTNKLNTITNDANARKQDFIGLFQKIQSTEQRLKNSTTSLEASQNMSFLKLQQEIIHGDQRLQNITETMEDKQNTTHRDIKQEYTNMFSQAKQAEQNLSERTNLLEMRENSTSLQIQQQTVFLQQELHKMSIRVKQVEQNLSNRTTLLEMRENSTSIKLEQQTVMLQKELNKMSNRVALTTCVATEGDVHGVIKFTDVKTANGIHNTDLIRNSGIFTCENPGRYIISFHISSNTTHSLYFAFKNHNLIGVGLSSLTDGYQTTSVTVIENLRVNDTISVRTGMYVLGGTRSCLTILQI